MHRHTFDCKNFGQSLHAGVYETPYGTWDYHIQRWSFLDRPRCPHASIKLLPHRSAIHLIIKWFRFEMSCYMFTWLARVVGRGGARAGPRGHSVISILLVAQNQHQATTIQADLLWQWIARDFLVGKKGFYSVDALRYWAFYLVNEFLSIHLNSPIPYRPGSYLTLLLSKCLKRGKVL